ncbi:MAG TPA: YkgJ family cysteine cluster protein [Acidimicrobiales bacterium]|jgi:Fe-S-cluster containining protein|nr:YkgJ family cysteine cluster protein [Acidimicrobiales bacterium]
MPDHAAPAGQHHRDGGDFATWVGDVQAAIRGERDAVVPCDGCVACCTSSQFVHIGPDETETLRRIPAELQVPAPGLPRGHVVLGYDERGHCPMLVDNQCSIYEHRPRTCRSFDCRVFTATGVEPSSGQAAIAERAREWRFRLATTEDAATRDALRAAGEFLRREGGISPRRLGPTQLAALAIEIHHLFLGGIEPDADLVRRYEAGRRSGSPKAGNSSAGVRNE